MLRFLPFTDPDAKLLSQNGIASDCWFDAIKVGSASHKSCKQKQFQFRMWKIHCQRVQDGKKTQAKGCVLNSHGPCKNVPRAPSSGAPLGPDKDHLIYVNSSGASISCHSSQHGSHFQQKTGCWGNMCCVPACQSQKESPIQVGTVKRCSLWPLCEFLKQTNVRKCQKPVEQNRSRSVDFLEQPYQDEEVAFLILGRGGLFSRWWAADRIWWGPGGVEQLSNVHADANLRRTWV